MVIYNHRIDINCPILVFGDGSHETTQHLLQLLNNYGFDGKSYIDVGCGTGILSIFASKIGLDPITAIDNDFYAIECTKDNTDQNNTANVKIIMDDIARVNDLTADIVTGNFAQSMAIYYLPILSRFVADGGLLMVTWFKSLDKLPTDELDWQIIDHIEGIEYDAYVLRKGTN